LPTLSSLRAFEAAARHGSFKLGAHELGVTPTSISHQVKSLEDQLGVKLFERFNRRVELTRAGEHYARALTSAFDGIDGATRTLAAMANREAASERLVIACNPGFIDCWLRARLADFQARHPGIWPEIISTDAIREALAKGAQLGIHHGQLLRGVDCELLTDTRFFPVCSPDLLNGEHALRTPADLRHHTLLHEASTSHWGAWLRAAGAPAEIDWRAGPVFHSSVLVIETAVAGQGVGLGDELIAGDHLEAGRLVKPFAATPTSTEASYLVAPDAGAGMSTAARVFRDWLVGQIAAFRPLMARIRRLEPFITPAAR
jgi:LysR family glycine cleavage system transcriptional activator